MGPAGQYVFTAEKWNSLAYPQASATRVLLRRLHWANECRGDGPHAAIGIEGNSKGRVGIFPAKHVRHVPHLVPKQASHALACEAMGRVGNQDDDRGPILEPENGVE